MLGFCGSVDLPLTKAELFEQWATDAETWIADTCRILSYGPEGIIPFVPNAIQRDYYREIWQPNVQHDICPKPRKYGLTTWRLALGLHALHFLPAGRVFRIICHRLETANHIKGLLRSLVESSWTSTAALGDDPAYYLRRVVADNALGYEFAGGSLVRIDTAAGKGVGQADRNDDLYLTEFSEYDHGLANLEALMGSQPVGHPDNRFTIDFNAVEGWMSSEAYGQLQLALKGPGHELWNGFHVFFRGTNDLPGYYKPEWLVTQQASLRHRFYAVYPRTIDDLYVQQEKCVHKLVDIEAARDRVSGEYLVEHLGGRLPRNLQVVHGVDTSLGLRPDDPHNETDWQTCVSLAFYDGLWWELCPPVHEKVPEDVFAAHVDDRVRRYPGLVVVERNVGSAVLVKLRELDTPNIYRHRTRDKDGKHRLELGFPTTYSTKRRMIQDTDTMLREGSLGLVTPDLLEEMRDIEWYDSGGLQKPMEGRRSPLAGAPDRKGAHDDLWMGLNLGIQGIVSQTGLGYDVEEVESAWE